MSARDDARKTDALTDVLPHLSAQVTARIAASVELPQNAPTGPFARFLRKLLQVTACDPTAADILGARWETAGLPRELLEALARERDDVDDVEVGSDAAAEASWRAAAADATPREYGDRLDLLSRSCLMPAELGDLVLQLHDGAVDEHLTQIAATQARKAPAVAGLAVYLEALAGMREGACARGDLGVLATIADVVLHLRQTPGAVPAEAIVHVSHVTDALASDCVLALAVGAVAGPDRGGRRQGHIILSAGERAAAAAVIDAIARAEHEDARQALALTLVAISGEGVEAAVSAGVARHREVAAACLSALPLMDPDRAFDVAMWLVGHHQVDLRLAAMRWLVDAPLTKARWRRVLQRVGEAGETALLASTLDGAKKHAAESRDWLMPALRQSASKWSRDLQAQAVAAVIASGQAGISDLVGELRGRGWKLAAALRALARTMASALAALTTPSARQAAAAWRRSPAAILSAWFPSGESLR